MAPRLLIGTRKGSFVAERGPSGWGVRRLGHAGAGVNYLARDPFTGRLWALLGHGHWGAKLSISDDDGATWADAPTQLRFPAGARYIGQDMFEDETAEFGAGIRVVTRAATVQKLWVIGFGRGGRVYVGTIPGGLFESHDGGLTFELNRPLWNHPSRGGDLFVGEGTGETKWFGTPAAEGGDFAPGIHSIVVDPTDDQRVLVAVSTAGVIETRDGGRSWHSANRGMTMDHQPDAEAEWGHDTHFIEACAGDPRHVWQQNHAGVFYSDDGAASWRRVDAPEQGVHFGFPVTTDAVDGRTAWLLPARSDQQRTAIDGALVVARTTDGGQTWTRLTRGLPQSGAWDIVYRHALTNQAGHVAFGSTTGNLYVSDDRGDSWAAVSQNLPPIYSVRFA